MSTIRLYLDDDETLIALNALMRYAQLELAKAQTPGRMHAGDHLIAAREYIRLARKVANILPADKIPHRLSVMEHAIAIALTDRTRHESISQDSRAGTRHDQE